MEHTEDVNLIKAFHGYTNEDGVLMREYHIDTHPILSKYVRNKKMRGDLSVRKRLCDRPLIIVGQDECIVKQYSFSSKCWTGKDGEKKLLPKSDGYSIMFSAFCARCFGLGLTVSDEELEEINQRRNSERFSHYISQDAAMEIYGSTKKKLLTDEDKLTLVQSMMVGINADGY